MIARDVIRRIEAVEVAAHFPQLFFPPDGERLGRFVGATLFALGSESTAEIRRRSEFGGAPRDIDGKAGAGQAGIVETAPSTPTRGGSR